MHIRHSLDHYASVCAAIGSPHLNVPAVLKYDERSRDAETECNRKKATELCERFLATLRRADVAQPVTVEFMGNPGTGDTYALPSNLGREISFVAHHGVHHLATVRRMMEAQGYTLNSSIGVANATLNHQMQQQRQQQQCKDTK